MFATRRIKLLSLALLMSGGTVTMTQQWLQGEVRQARAEARAQAPAAAQPVVAARVLVASAAIPAGAILKAGDLRWQAWPGDPAASGYLTSANTKIEQLTGAVVRTALAPGEPLSAGRVAQPGEHGVLAAALQPGYRAVSVNVSASSSVAGLVLPGDRVDVILSRSLGDGVGGPPRFESETVLTNVRVVGMDQRTTNEKKDAPVPQTATLEVTPKGAEILAVANDLGKLSLSLRSLGDADVADVRHVTRTSDRDATQGIASAPAAVPARRRATASAPRVASVEVVRGAAS